MAQRQRRDDDLDIPPLANTVFAGEEAAQHLARQGITGPANAIALARSLRAQGIKNPKEIHARTSELLRGTPYAGVHFAADGTPRFEITDHTAKVRKGALGSSGKAYLGDVLDHPELYKAVPGSSMPTVSVSTDGNSSYTPGSQEIEVGKQHTARLGRTTVLKDTATGPLLHETQHVVQDLHGLTPGASPDHYRGLYPGNSPEAGEKRRLAYKMTAGEQEAEATRIRQNLTAEERRWRPPTHDMDVPVNLHRRPPVEVGAQMQFGGDLPKGYSVTRKSDADLARYNATEYTIRHNGNEVGTAFVTDLGDKVKVSKIDIAASHTRKGIGTALYGQIERDFGKALVPDDHLSPKAYAFWQKHRPDALGDHRVLKSGNAVRDPHGYLASEYAPAKQMFLDDLADRAIDAWNRATTREVVEGRPIHQRRLDPRRVAADPGTFQFKSGGDKAGVTDRLKGVKEWDPLAAGKQIVYQRANGEYVIADGHQRRGLALRALEAGQKDVALDAYVLREKDGWSPRDVRAYAALKNMKESSGNALDMAKVMRERPDLAAKSLPMSDAKIRDAVSLSKLSPAAFDMVEAGVIKPEHAAAVGARVGDTARHADMITEMAKAGMRSAEHARIYVSQAMAAGSITETTGSLFGDETKVRSLLAERARILDRALSSLKSDKRIFALLEREAANIEAAGNRLAHASNLERADSASRLAELVERLSTTRGPVSEMLDKAALDMAEGKSPAQAARAFVGDVGKVMKSGGVNALLGDAAPPSMAAPADPNQGAMFGEQQGKPQGWSDDARAASAEVRKGKAKGKQPKARGRKQMMVEDGSPKPGKDIRPEFAKGQFALADMGRSLAFSDGWKAAKSGRRLAAGVDPDFAAGYRQYQTDKSPRAAERAMIQHLAKGGDVHILGDNKVTLAGSTMPEKGKPGQTSGGRLLDLQVALRRAMEAVLDDNAGGRSSGAERQRLLAAQDAAEKAVQSYLAEQRRLSPPEQRGPELNSRMIKIAAYADARESLEYALLDASKPGREIGALGSRALDEARRVYELASMGRPEEADAALAKLLQKSKVIGDTNPEKILAQNIRSAGARRGLRLFDDGSVRRVDPSMLMTPTASIDVTKTTVVLEPAKGQTSFLPDATTKEQIAAAAKAKGKPSAAQLPADDGMFGSGVNQTDLVEMAKKPEPRGMDGLTRSERAGKAAPIQVQAGAAQGASTMERFRSAYEATLAEQVRANPSKYAYGPDRVPEMARRMTEALASGNGDNSSPTVKAVAKALGIDTTVGGMKAALNDLPPPAPKPKAEGLSAREMGAVSRAIKSGASVKPDVIARATNAQVSALDDVALAARRGQTGGGGDWGKINNIESWRSSLRERARITSTEAVAQSLPAPKQVEAHTAALTQTENSGVTYSASQAERDRVEAGTKRVGDTATDRYPGDMRNHPKRTMATATSTATIKPIVGPNGTTGEYQIVEDHYTGSGNKQSKVGSTTYSERYASREAAVKAMETAPHKLPTFDEAFGTGKPSGWSDEARDASAQVRKENAVGKSRKQSKAQVEKAAARENYRRVMGSDAPAKMTTAQLRKAAPANAPSKSDPFAVKLVPTAQREGPQGLAKALSGMTAQDLRTAAKAQGIHVPANRKTTESVREYVARATFGKIADRVAAAGGDQAPYIHMAAEAANHLRGTQNPENMKAIVANKKAKAKGKASSGAAEANAALAARKESLRGKSKASGADVIKALGDGRKGRGRKQSFVDDGTARPALPSTAKPSLASRAGRAFNVAGTAGLVAGVGAAAVMAANESAAKGESVGKQVAAGATAAGVAAAPAVAVGGAMAAAAKWGGATVAKAVPVVGWGIAGAAAVHGAVTAGREAAKDGKGAGGVAKAAAWGAVNSVVPIDAAMQAARSVRARMSSGPQRLSPEQAGQYAQANDSFQRQQALNTTQTDTPLERKPGWSPEARVAAAKARGAVNLPYGGNPASAPNYTTPKAG